MKKNKSSSLKEQFKKYKKEYKRMQIELWKKGSEMYDRMLDYSEFKAVYNQYHDEALAEVEAGIKKSVGNIIKKIIRDQTYEYSEAQYKAFRRALKETGIRSSMRELKQETWIIDSLMDTLKEEGKKLKEQGMSSSEIAHEIAVSFFGSPE